MPAAERTRMYQVRPRRVPPEFCTDELLEDCSVVAALLLYRLISLADDQGRLAGNSRTIRASAFALRPAISLGKVETALPELGRAGFIIPYDVAGRHFIQISDWFDMQGKWGLRRTYASRYPAPPGWEHDWVTAGTDDDEVRADGARSAGDVRPPLPPSSSSASTGSPTGLGGRRRSASKPERIDELLARARQGHLSDQDAFELGGMVAAAEETRERAPR